MDFTWVCHRNDANGIFFFFVKNQFQNLRLHLFTEANVWNPHLSRQRIIQTTVEQESDKVQFQIKHVNRRH